MNGQVELQTSEYGQKNTLVIAGPESEAVQYHAKLECS